MAQGLEKDMLRKSIRGKNKALSPEYTDSSDRMIADKLMGLTEYKTATTVFCFVSMPSEINTLPLLRDMWRRGVRTAVPLCTHPGVMQARLITCMGDLDFGKYGILEPRSTSRRLEKEHIDFSIVPCLSCDSSGGRLGKGGGYYDRFLKNRRFKAAALCREILLSKKLPLQEWDERVDMVVTEWRCIRACLKNPANV